MPRLFLVFFIFIGGVKQQSVGSMDTYLLTANTKGQSLSIINLFKNEEEQTIPLNGGPREVIADKQTLWVTFSEKPNLVCWDLKQNNITKDVTFPSEVRGLTFGPDKNHLIGVLKESHQIFKYDIATGSVVHAKTAQGPRQTLITEDGIWVSGNQDHHLCLHDKDSLAMLQTMTVPKNPYALCAVSPYQIAASSIGENVIAIVDTSSAKVTEILPSIVHPTSLLKTEADQLWATSFDDHTVHIYDLKTLQHIKSVGKILNPFSLGQTATHVWCTSYQSGQVVGIHKKTLTIDHHIKVGDQPHHLFITPSFQSTQVSL